MTRSGAVRQSSSTGSSSPPIRACGTRSSTRSRSYCLRPCATGRATTIFSIRSSHAHPCGARRRFARQAVAVVDASGRRGDNHKTSEIGLLDKVEDKANFLAPGLLSPFNPNIYNHPADLIRGFGNCLPFLQLQHGHRVLDSGCGYGWTTEWLMNLGIDAVGIDISRVYPMSDVDGWAEQSAHLVVGDSENLPFRAGVFDAVLCFDAFHHIPDRPAAMRRYERALKDPGRIVLLEPGGQHETDEVSVNVMDTYGIMEVGMELADVQGYIDGIETFGPARQIFLTPHLSDDPRTSVPISELRDRSYIGWGMFSHREGCCCYSSSAIVGICGTGAVSNPAHERSRPPAGPCAETLRHVLTKWMSPCRRRLILNSIFEPSLPRRRWIDGRSRSDHFCGGPSGHGGSAIVRRLRELGHERILTADRRTLDLLIRRRSGASSPTTASIRSTSPPLASAASTPTTRTRPSSSTRTC